MKLEYIPCLLRILVWETTGYCHLALGGVLNRRFVEWTHTMPPATCPSVKSGILGFFILILFGFITAAFAQLPSEIMADAYLLQVEQAVRDGDLDRGRTVIHKIRTLQERHELDLEVEFYFRYATAAGTLGMSDLVLESVVKYLAAAGREGRHYGEALALMNRSRAGSSSGDIPTKLSPDVIADAHLADAAQAIRDGDLARAKAAVQESRALQ